MTNLERWRLYTRDLVSPESFIDFGFYFLTSAALQRRVWLGDIKFKAVFPNLYVIFVGNPGIGKSLVIGEITKLLRHHELKVPELSTNDPDAPKELKLLFPAGMDTTSFENLTKSISRSTRVFKDPKTEKIYSHASVVFTLEELSSMFRKHHEQIVKLFSQAFDAGDFIYETLSRGRDIIRRCCIAMLAGAQPDFMEEAFDSRIMAEGFLSRCIFIYETVPRFKRWEIPQLTTEQQTAREHLLDWILRLSNIYGEITFAPEADAFLREWWEQCNSRRNTSPKLIHYYAKKNLLVKKLAICIHFAESLEFTPISLLTCQTVLSLLESVETNMHLALNFSPKNILSPAARSIDRYLTARKEGATARELLTEFYDDIPEGDIGLEKVLQHLEYLGKITHQDSAGERKYVTIGKSNFSPSAVTT